MIYTILIISLYLFIKIILETINYQYHKEKERIKYSYLIELPDSPEAKKYQAIQALQGLIFFTWLVLGVISKFWIAFIGFFFFKFSLIKLLQSKNYSVKKKDRINIASNLLDLFFIALIIITSLLKLKY